MKVWNRLVFLLLLAGAASCCNADDRETAVTREQIEAHVREQFLVYGPLSKQHEYFGYLYCQDGVISSAVMRGPQCSSPRNCGLETAGAARLIPRGAQILGEWHTHPHSGSGQLSDEDVRGAYANRHIRGYAAYYSKPNGEILAWDTRQDEVPAAMASAVRIGNYRASPLMLTQRATREIQRR